MRGKRQPLLARFARRESPAYIFSRFRSLRSGTKHQEEPGGIRLSPECSQGRFQLDALARRRGSTVDISIFRLCGHSFNN